MLWLAFALWPSAAGVKVKAAAKNKWVFWEMRCGLLTLCTAAAGKRPSQTLFVKKNILHAIIWRLDITGVSYKPAMVVLDATVHTHQTSCSRRTAPPPRQQSRLDGNKAIREVKSL